MRVLSYNIHKGVGGRDRKYRLARIEAVVAAANADVLCLQEVDRNVRRTRFDDQPKRLAEGFLGRRLPPVGPHPGAHAADSDPALGGGAVFGLTLPLTTGRLLPGGPHKGGYGNLLVSKYPILEAHLIGLQRGLRKNRGAILAVLQTPDGPVRIVNWHLGLNNRERLWQARRLLNHELFQNAGEPHGGELPTLLIGDTNDWRGTLPGGALGEAGYELATAPAGRFRSFPAWLPAAALDRAFVKDLTLTEARVGLAEAEANGGGPSSVSDKDASDHLPLLAEVRIGASKRGK